MYLSWKLDMLLNSIGTIALIHAWLHVHEQATLCRHAKSHTLPHREEARSSRLFKVPELQLQVPLSGLWDTCILTGDAHVQVWSADILDIDHRVGEGKVDYLSWPWRVAAWNSWAALAWAGRTPERANMSTSTLNTPTSGRCPWPPISSRACAVCQTVHAQ